MAETVNSDNYKATISEIRGTDQIAFYDVVIQPPVFFDKNLLIAISSHVHARDAFNEQEEESSPEIVIDATMGAQTSKGTLVNVSLEPSSVGTILRNERAQRVVKNIVDLMFEAAEATDDPEKLDAFTSKLYPGE